jgi:hypothetical protein
MYICEDRTHVRRPEEVRSHCRPAHIGPHPRDVSQAESIQFSDSPQAHPDFSRRLRKQSHHVMGVCVSMFIKRMDSSFLYQPRINLYTSTTDNINPIHRE